MVSPKNFTVGLIRGYCRPNKEPLVVTFIQGLEGKYVMLGRLISAQTFFYDSNFSVLFSNLFGTEKSAGILSFEKFVQK